MWNPAIAVVLFPLSIPQGNGFSLGPRKREVSGHKLHAVMLQAFWRWNGEEKWNGCLNRSLRYTFVWLWVCKHSKSVVAFHCITVVSGVIMVQTGCWNKLRLGPCVFGSLCFCCASLHITSRALLAAFVICLGHWFISPPPPLVTFHLNKVFWWSCLASENLLVFSLLIYWKSFELSRLVIAHVISVLIAFRAAELLLLHFTGERKRKVKDPGQHGLSNRWVSSNLFSPSCWITALLVLNKTRKGMYNVERSIRKKRDEIWYV